MLHIGLKTLKTDTFNDFYFELHQHLLSRGEIAPSRNGPTTEFLDFTTRLTNPTHRCVAGHRRDVNIFFLLAEALWIYVGRRDVEFLDIFNGKLKDYSDDGVYYHAPYGWRLRNYGMHSLTPVDETNVHSMSGGVDQLVTALTMLNINPDDRRVVMAIWNAEFDLMVQSKDIPCNDLVMAKVRHDGLHLTIQNRSNDLNWGLTTNIFQFSILGEIMACLLGVKYAGQTHNSQSLHLYIENDLTIRLKDTLEDLIKDFQFQLYEVCKTLPIEFKFKDSNFAITEKIRWVDFHVRSIIVRLLGCFKNQQYDDVAVFEADLLNFSKFLFAAYKILEVYVHYKKHKSHVQALIDITKIGYKHILYEYDYFLLAANFFLARIAQKQGKEEWQRQLTIFTDNFTLYKGVPIGLL